MSRRNSKIPYFYWSKLSLLFFSLWGCQSLPWGTSSVRDSLSSGPVLSFQSPRKLNPTYFKEGSSHFAFVEWDESTNTAQKTEISLFLYEPEFLAKWSETYKLADVHSVRFVRRQKKGNLTILDPQKKFRIVYDTFTQTDSFGKSLLEVLEKTTNFPNNNIQKIQEYEVFEIEGKVATLVEEGYLNGTKTSIRWNHNHSTVFGPATSIVEKNTDKTLEYGSASYDYSQTKYEFRKTEADTVFTKFLYKDGNLEFYFIPPLTNQNQRKAQVPFGTKRFGDFLVKEEPAP